MLASSFRLADRVEDVFEGWGKCRLPQHHASLTWRTSRLLAVAGRAGDNHVGPLGAATLTPRHDVVDGVAVAAAVRTCVAVPLPEVALRVGNGARTLVDPSGVDVAHQFDGSREVEGAELLPFDGRVDSRDLSGQHRDRVANTDTSKDLLPTQVVDQNLSHGGPHSSPHIVG